MNGNNDEAWCYGLAFHSDEGIEAIRDAKRKQCHAICSNHGASSSCVARVDLRFAGYALACRSGILQRSGNAEDGFSASFGSSLR